MDWRWETVVDMVAKRHKVDATLRGKPHPNTGSPTRVGELTPFLREQVAEGWAPER